VITPRASLFYVYYMIKGAAYMGTNRKAVFEKMVKLALGRWLIKKWLIVGYVFDPKRTDSEENIHGCYCVTEISLIY